MSSLSIAKRVESLIEKHRVIVWLPIAQDMATRVLEDLHNPRTDLVELHAFCNGLSLKWLTILPISVTVPPFPTLQQANRHAESPYLGGDPGMFERFLVFADIGDGECAAIDREDASIWFQDGEDLSRTDLNLFEFIVTCVREIDCANKLDRSSPFSPSPRVPAQPCLSKKSACPKILSLSAGG